MLRTVEVCPFSVVDGKTKRGAFMVGKWLFLGSSALTLTLLWSDAGIAGTTGKVHGFVRDLNGAPLPGTNVLVEETRRGGVTDANGYYFILSVDPGAYRLTASLVGYDKVTRKEVQVVADYTSTVNFELKETAVQMSEVVVTAERPPVEPDKTDSKYAMSRQDIQALPMTRSLTDIVTLQPGVYQTDATVIRGGDPQDVAYYVDGIRLSNNDVYGRQFTGINKTAIQELVVISGGATAEYGNLESGVVSVVTRDGSQNFHGWADFRYTPPGKKHWGANVYDNPIHREKMKWDDRSWTSETVTLGPGPDGKLGTGDDQTALAHRRLPYTDEKGYFVEGGMSGPLSRRASFIFTGRWTRQAYTLPGPALHTPPSFYGNLKLSFDLASHFRLKVGQIYGYQEGYRTGTNAQRDLDSNGQNVFLPEGSGAGKYKLTDNLTYLALTHAISPRTFYEIRVSRYRTTEDTLDVPNAGWNRFGFPLSALPKKDTDGWFNAVPAKAVDVLLSQKNRWELKADFSSQVTHGHFLKTGAEAVFYDLYYYRYQSLNPGARQVTFVTQPGNLPHVRRPVRPIQLAFYAQDKMEFEGLIMNVGVRFDAFYTNTRPYNSSILQSPQYRWLIFHKDMPTYPARWTTAISPRLGVSHPITSRSAYHFTAGVYTRLPDLADWFYEVWSANLPDDYVPYDAFRGIRSQQYMMSAFIQPERTRAFEAGADWNFVSDYIAGIAAYYKSAIGKVTTLAARIWVDPTVIGGPGLPYTYVWGRKPNAYQDLKGIEVSFRKKFSHLFSFNAALNFGWANAGQIGSNATLFTPDSSYVADDNRYYDYQWDRATGNYVKKSLSEADRKRLGNVANTFLRTNIFYNSGAMESNWFQLVDAQKVYGAPPGIVGAWQPAYGGTLYAPKGVDRRTMANIQVFFQSPRDFGPGVRGWNPIGDLRANLVYRVRSGTSVTYTPPDRQAEVRYRPIEATVDLQVEKTLVAQGSRDMIFYIEVFNLFNQRDSNIPFNYLYYAQWGLNLPTPYDPTFQQYGDYNELTPVSISGVTYTGRYGASAPRQVHLGVRVNF